MVKRLDIIVHPDDRLRVVSTPVDPQEIPLLEETFRSMVTTMLKTKTGVGLAGVQVGIPRRFFVMQGDHDPSGSIEIAVNPSWVGSDETPKGIKSEGCLSFPNVVETVERYSTIIADYISVNPYDMKIEEKKGVKLTGLKAHVFQHEVEHLDGKVFIEHLSEKMQKRITGRLKKWQAKGYVYP